MAWEYVATWLMSVSVTCTGATLSNVRSSNWSSVRRRGLCPSGLRRGLPARLSQMRSQALLLRSRRFRTGNFDMALTSKKLLLGRQLNCHPIGRPQKKRFSVRKPVKPLFRQEVSRHEP